MLYRLKPVTPTAPNWTNKKPPTMAPMLAMKPAIRPKCRFGKKLSFLESVVILCQAPALEVLYVDIEEPLPV